MTLKAWLDMWWWRITESLSTRLPDRYHERACPFCRGWNRHVREREQT
jgi:hypothetical protein